MAAVVARYKKGEKSTREATLMLDDDPGAKEAVKQLLEELDRTIASVLCADLLPGVRGELYLLARKRTGGNADAAAELVAATEARVCQRFHQFKVRYNLRKDFRAWTFEILERLAADAARAPEAREVSLDEPAIAGADSDGPSRGDTLILEGVDLAAAPIRSSVADALARAGFWEALASASSRLAPLDRAIIQIAFMGEEPLRNREVAAILGSTPGSVGVQKHRALAALRRALEEWCSRDPRNLELLQAYLEESRNR